MQRRLLGSVIVVAAGLLPAVIGGAVFALLMALLGIIALREFLRFRHDLPVPGAPWIWYSALLLAATGALLNQSLLIYAAILAGVLLSLAICIPRTARPGVVESWAWGVAGLAYIGLSITAAIVLRQAPGGEATAAWQNVASRFALGWPSAAAGLAWVLAVILATWAGDSAAYLTGRAIGRHKLAPSVSPGKTLEGAVGGLLAAIVVSATVFSVSGVLPALAGALVGVVIGVSGQCGDLCESFLKRQFGLKDSGDLIPGHGGMLDRIDALLFAFPATLLIALVASRGAG